MGSVLSWPWQVLLLAGLPLVLMLVTSFIKISVVLSLLRRALGAPEVPSTAIVLAVSILLSVFVMAPVALDVARSSSPLLSRPGWGGEATTPPRGRAAPEGEVNGVSARGVPLVRAQVRRAQRVAQRVAEAESALSPLKAWLVRHSGASERATFRALGQRLHRPSDHDLLGEPSWLVVVPAFVLTELKEAFIIGFVIFVPFLVIDLVVASVLLGLGMPMVNPMTLSLPFKLLLFVMVDGWRLLVEGLILGYVALS